MEILSAQEIQISNFECLQILKQVKSEHGIKKNKNKSKNDRLLTLVLETIKYLEDSPAGLQEETHLQEFVTNLQTFCIEENCLLTKKEIIQLVNIRPQTPVEIQLLIDDSEERLSEEQVQKIIEIIGTYIPGPEEENVEEETVEGEDGNGEEQGEVTEDLPDQAENYKMGRDDSRERKSKKKKSKKSRSRSRSRSRERKRARSRSRDRRSRSRGRRSRSRSRGGKRSRSRDRRSRDRRSRTKSRSRDRKSRRSRSRSRRRSNSRGRRRSRSDSRKRSVSRSRRSDSRSRRRSRSVSKGANSKTTSQKSRETSKSPEKKSEIQLSIGEEMKRQRQIADIESESFVQQDFRSDTRTVSMKGGADEDDEIQEVGLHFGTIAEISANKDAKEIWKGWEPYNPVSADYSPDTSDDETEKKLPEEPDLSMMEEEMRQSAMEEHRRIIAEIARNWDSRVEESKRKHKSLAILIEAKEEEKQRKAELNMKRWARAIDPSGAPSYTMNEIMQDPVLKEKYLEDTQALHVFKSSKLLSKTKAKLKQIDQQERAKQMEEEAARIAAQEEKAKVEKEDKNEIIGSIHEYANLMGKSVKELAEAKYEPPEESSSDEEGSDGGGDEDGNLWGAIMGSGGAD